MRQHASLHWMGQLEAVGVGAPFLRWDHRLQRAHPSWHALLEAPADGEMLGWIEEIISITVADPDVDYEESWPSCIRSIKFTFGKSTHFGQGPFGAAFRTPLTLPDMPAILASLL